MVQFDLRFPITFIQKHTRGSILSRKQTNSKYQSFNNVMFECWQTSGFIWYDLHFIYSIINLTSKTGRKNNVEEYFRCSH